MHLAVFELGRHRYALDIGRVREITRAVAVTHVPAAPEVVEGIVSLRGEIACVTDMRRRFGLPAVPPSAGEQMIFALAGERLVAVRVDRVLEVIEIDPALIDSIEGAVPGSRHVAGVVSLPGGLTLIHDLATFLSETEKAALDALELPP